MINLGPSPFDVNLVAFRIPIRVHWSFWLAMALLGWHPERFDLVFLWVVCGFISILVHELGHALTAESFGWPSHILMYFGGGLAFSDRHHRDTPGRSLTVSIMGPGAGFLLYLATKAVRHLIIVSDVPVHPYVAYVINVLMYINLWWGILNLIPVLPLDGGHICSSLCQMLGLRDPVGMTLKVGVVASGVAAWYMLSQGRQQYMGIMMLMLCIQNVTMLQSRR